MDWLRRLPLVNRFLAEPDTAAPSDWEGPAFGPRILIEEEDASLRGAMANALQAAGYQTSGCPGPGSGHERHCPLVDGEDCDAVDQAAGVLQLFVPSERSLDEVRAAIHEHSPDTPVVVICPMQAANRHADVLVRARVSTEPLSRRGVVAAVRDSVVE